jgi:hypothetical protein
MHTHLTLIEMLDFFLKIIIFQITKKFVKGIIENLKIFFLLK